MNSFGKQTILDLCKQHLPYLEVEYVEPEDRGTKDNPTYGEDELYEKWDTLFLNENEDIFKDWNVVILIFEEDSEIKIKFYCDSVAFNGTSSDDEYMNNLDGVKIADFTKEHYQHVLASLKEFLDC